MACCQILILVHAADVQQQHFSALFLYPGFCSWWYHDSLDDTDLKPDLLWENRVADTGPHRDCFNLVFTDDYKAQVCDWSQAHEASLCSCPVSWDGFR